MNKIYLLFLSLFLIACGSESNIFNNGGKNNSDRIGDILPVEANLELLLDSPLSGSTEGKTVKIEGRCSAVSEVTIVSTKITLSPLKVKCEDNRFSTNVDFNSTSNESVQVSVQASTRTQNLERQLTLNIKMDIPSIATHIDFVTSDKDSISLDWNSSSSTDLDLKGYYLEYKESLDSDWIQVGNSVITETNYRVRNLSSSTSYDFRVRSFNGNYSAYSSVSGSTKPNHPFFLDKIKSINIAGASKSSLVAIEAGDFYLNGSLLKSLGKGEVHKFDSNQFDIISSEAAFFIAGLKSLGNGANRKGNVVWTTQDWAAKNFSFSASRSALHKLNIVAFEAAEVVVKRGTTVISSNTMVADQGIVIDLPTNANYTIESTGIVSGYLYSATNANNQIQDPRPLLPNSTDLLGVPSRQGFASSSRLGAVISGTHSNDAKFTHTFNNLSSLFKITVKGTADRYKSEAVRLKSTAPIEAISNADFDGYGSAPFLPRAKMKNTYAVNVSSEWVVLVSIKPGTITVTKPGGATSTVSLARSGSDDDAPFKARFTDMPEGTIFQSSVKTAAWYEPKTDDYGANDDETLLFGYDL